MHFQRGEKWTLLHPTFWSDPNNLYARRRWRYRRPRAAAVTVEMMVQGRGELSRDATIKEEFCFLANEWESQFELRAWVRLSRVLFAVCLPSDSLERELMEYDGSQYHVIVS